MSRLRVSLDEIVPIKQAVRALPRALDRLERSETAHLVITRRNQPRAVLISLERYELLLEASEETHSRRAA
jgi:prevent-host-death family protein